MTKLRDLNEILDEIKNEDEQTKILIESTDKAIEIINKITKTRESLNITQRELAEKCGIKQPALARIESFVNIPKITTLIRIAQSLNISIEALNQEEKSMIDNIENVSICKIVTINYDNREGMYRWNQQLKICQ